MPLKHTFQSEKLGTDVNHGSASGINSVWFEQLSLKKPVL